MPELQQLENQGWEQMLQMLNQHLPQEAPPHPAPVRPIRYLFMLAAAACLGMLFCMPVLLTDSHRPVLPETVYTDGPSRHLLSNPTDTSSGVLHFAPAFGTGITTTAFQKQPAAATASTPTIAIAAPEHYINNYDSVVNAAFTNADAQVIACTALVPSAAATGIASDEKIPQRLPLIFFPEAAPATAAQAALKNKQSLLSLSVQLNHNLNSQYYNTGNFLYNIPAYPSVTASVHVNKNISFTTGISVMAPGSLNGQVKSEASTPVNNGDVATSMAVVDRDVVRQAYYMQVPVTMDVAVRRNLAISSGAGFAFLQKALVQREARTTDAGNNEFVPRTARPAITTTLLNKQEATEPATSASRLYNIKRSERRFLLNIQYQLKNFTFGLQYSRALSPSVEFPDHPERNIRNQTINLSVGMPLFRR